MIIQVSHGPDTVIVTESPNKACAAIRDLIQTNPDTLPPLEVDLWSDGVIEESYGFVPLESELPRVAEFIMKHC